MSRSFLSELKRRHVFRAAATYLIAAWLILQVTDVIGPAVGLPAGAMRVLIVLTVFGLAVTIAVSWMYDRAGATLVPTAAEVDTKSPEKPIRLIVLPFRILRPGGEVDFLGFAIADAISASLVGIRSLVLRSTLSVPESGSETTELKTLAKTLDVDAVVSGTLLQVDQQLQVRAQLTLVPDGTVLWAHTEQITAADLFQFQTRVTSQVVTALRLPLSARERVQHTHDRPSTPRAYEHYLRANQLSVQSGQWADARDLYEECLKEDPEFAPAWARLGRCHRLLARWAADEQTAAREMTAAEQAFRRALDLNPELPLAHSLYAQLELDFGRSEHAMVRLLARVEATGAHPELLAGVVQACRFCGLLEQSVAAYRLAIALDPNVRTSVAHTYFMLGNHEAALAEYNNADIGYLEALCLTMLGREEEAIALLKGREAKLEGTQVGHYLASLRALLEGKHDESVHAMEHSVDSGLGRDGEGTYDMKRQFARLGETERALTLFQRMIDYGFNCYPAFARDPWLNGLRELPAAKALLRRAELASRQALSMFRDTGGERLLSNSVPFAAQPSHISSLMPSGSLKPT
ncbi:MAG: tetratricopeptide repeat protein [Gemmatimonadota bacterium]